MIGGSGFWVFDDVDPSNFDPINPHDNKPGTYHGFAINSKAPIFTNENLNGLEDLVSLEGKRVFGVVGSADHLIEAVVQGCEEYVGVDMSVISLFFAELKLAALKDLSYEDFRTFFGVTNRDLELAEEDFGHEQLSFTHFRSFSPNIYSRVRDGLSKPTRTFFDAVYTQPGLVHQFVYQTISKDCMDSIPYLRSKESYSRAQEALRAGKTNITFDLGNAVDFLRFVCSSFDVVYFSNLLEYEVGFASDRDAAVRSAMPILMSSLNDKGVIINYSDISFRMQELLEVHGYSSTIHHLSPNNRRNIFYNEVFVIPKK